jgi:hypothetical protein
MYECVLRASRQQTCAVAKCIAKSGHSVAYGAGVSASKQLVHAE